MPHWTEDQETKLWIWSPVDGSGEQFVSDNPRDTFYQAFGLYPEECGVSITLIGPNRWSAVNQKTGRGLLIAPYRD